MPLGMNPSLPRRGTPPKYRIGRRGRTLRGFPIRSTPRQLYFRPIARAVVEFPFSDPVGIARVLDFRPLSRGVRAPPNGIPISRHPETGDMIGLFNPETTGHEKSISTSPFRGAMLISGYSTRPGMTLEAGLLIGNSPGRRDDRPPPMADVHSFKWAGGFLHAGLERPVPGHGSS